MPGRAARKMVTVTCLRDPACAGIPGFRASKTGDCHYFPRGGFTLLETIVSLAIMGLGLVAVLEAYTASMRLSLQDEYLTTATFLASGKMEEVLKEPYITAGSDEGDFGEDFEDFTWTVDITDSEIEGLELVTVTVQWAVATRDDELVLTTATPRREPEEETTGAGAGMGGGAR